MEADISEEAALLNEAMALHGAGRIVEAKAIYERLLTVRPDQPEVLRLLGTAEYQSGDLGACIAALSRSLELFPDQPGVEYNLGSVFGRLKRHEEALRHYDRAVSLKPDYAEAQYNRANTLGELGRAEEAVAGFGRAIESHPRYAKAYFNRAIILRKHGQHEAALDSYRSAINIDPRYAAALHNMGNLLADMGRLDEAIDCYDRVLAIDPDYEFLMGNAFHTRCHLADWSEFQPRLDQLAGKIRLSQKVTPPFPVFSLTDDPELQRHAAQVYAAAKHPPGQALAPIVRHGHHGRIRVGYFSSDFGNHPVTHLLAGMLERHDRRRFEVFAYAFGPDRRGPWRERVVSAVDHFVEVRRKSEREIAAIARGHEIDIAIDLNGYTGDCLPGIFAERAAPVQVSYIGYLGTMGAPYIDYLIADPVMVPETSRRFYSEQIVSLRSYQCNDDKQRIPDKTFKRQDFGLPETGFVYCSFNNQYKILPPVFDSWMRILKAVPESVIWLYVANQTATENLRREAERRGVESKRIVFATSVPYEDHVARQRLADLFLDTHPYNAGATASLALRAGLPILTRLGESFAARMGASLLIAAGLPEMIVATQEEYERQAIHLGTHPDDMKRIRRKLAENLPNCTLFDTERFTRNIEAAYAAMYERSRSGLPPQPIDVSAVG